MTDKSKSCFHAKYMLVEREDGFLRIKLAKRKKEKITTLTKSVPFDLTIQIGKNKIKAHKDVLKENIPYFEAMFSESFQEANQSTVEMKNLNIETVKNLVHYIYAGKLCINSDDVLDFFELSDLWILTDLRDLCVQLMVLEVDSVNCLGLWNLGRNRHCQELIEPCKIVLESQFPAVIHSDVFLELSAEDLIECLKLETLKLGSLGEEVVLQGALRWLEYKQEEREPELSKVLPHIRVSSISHQLRLKYIKQYQKYPALCERLESNEEQLPRSIKQCFYIFSGFFQSRTGKNCPKVQRNEKYNPDTSSTETFGYFDDPPMSQVAFNLFGKIVHIGVYSNKTTTDPKLIVKYLYPFNNKWKVVTDLFSEEALVAIRNCLLEKGCVVHCETNNKIYAVINRDQSVSISVTCKNGEVFCKVEKVLPTLTEFLEGSHKDMKAVCCGGNLYVMGGYVGPYLLKQSSDVNLMLSSDGNQWIPKPKMPTARGDFALVSYRNRIIVIGGYGDSRRLSSCDQFYTDCETWEPFPALKEARSNHSAVLINHKIYAMGGIFVKEKIQNKPKKGRRKIKPGKVSDYIEMVDPTFSLSYGSKWSRLCTMKEARFDFTIVRDFV